MAITWAVTGEGAQRMRSGTAGGCGQHQAASFQVHSTANRQSGYLQASLSAPSLPLATFQKIPFQKKFFTSGFSANKYAFSLRLEETTVISLRITFDRVGKIHSTFTSRKVLRWPFRHPLLKHECTLQGGAFQSRLLLALN